jgi:hypothetical protein
MGINSVMMSWIMFTPFTPTYVQSVENMDEMKNYGTGV